MDDGEGGKMNVARLLKTAVPAGTRLARTSRKSFRCAVSKGPSTHSLPINTQVPEQLILTNCPPNFKPANHMYAISHTPMEVKPFPFSCHNFQEAFVDTGVDQFHGIGSICDRILRLRLSLRMLALLRRL